MKNVSRRSFVSSTVGGMAALSVLATLTTPAEAELVWKASEWKLDEFHKLVKDPAKIKQVYDVRSIGDGKFLNNMKNSLNGLRFGFNVPKEQIKVVGALHGPANMLCYDNYVWNKYQIGEWLNVIDPETGKAAARNLYYNSRNPTAKETASTDPDDESGFLQDWSMQALQSRGISFPLQITDKSIEVFWSTYIRAGCANATTSSVTSVAMKAITNEFCTKAPPPVEVRVKSLELWKRRTGAFLNATMQTWP